VRELRRPARTGRLRDGLSDKEARMSEHTYKVTEVVGTSRTSIEEAVNNAVAKASQTLRNLRWFEVVETRGVVESGRVGHWQVTLKLGFTLED
jgi:flavin-binding protein dodecin